MKAKPLALPAGSTALQAVEASGLAAEFADIDMANLKLGIFSKAVKPETPLREVAELLERRDTWSGRTVLWPVADSGLRVPVDLAALPIYDRSRNFEGFRGFGVARPADFVSDPVLAASDGGSKAEREAAEVRDNKPPDVDNDEKHADKAPDGGEVPVLIVTDNGRRRSSDKIIQLAEHRAPLVTLRVRRGSVHIGTVVLATVVQLAGTVDRGRQQPLQRLADRAGHRGNAHDLALVAFQHEQVVGIGALGLATKGFLGPAHPMRQALLVGRQGGQASTCAARQIQQGWQVGATNGTNDHQLTP